jgi:hypothetical protein
MRTRRVLPDPFLSVVSAAPAACTRDGGRIVPAGGVGLVTERSPSLTAEELAVAARS